jgi:hypothetical protein
MTSVYPSNTRSDTAETIRLLLYSCDKEGDLGDLSSWPTEFLPPLLVDLDIVEWIWVHAAAVLDDQELAYLRCFLLASLVSRYHRCLRDSPSDDITDKILKLMDTQMLEYYLKSNVRLLDALYSTSTSSLNSKVVGASFVNLLTCLGLDVEACRTRELELSNGGLLRSGHFLSGARKIVFEPVDGGWLLGWIWVLDPSEPGYLLVSEYIGLGADSWYAQNWPFFPDVPLCDYEAYKSRWMKAEVRFTRQLANKARKERARTGQKRQRSKMPGAWNW